MNSFGQDIRYGIRLLSRNPGFSAIIVIILGIGIGSTTLMLSVIDATLFRPCPYRDPDRLVSIYEVTNPGKTNSAYTSIAGFKDWREQQQVFTSLAGANQWNGIVRTSDRTEKARGFFITEGLFTTLGVKPVWGRSFLPEDYEAGAESVIILSHDHWYHWFGGDIDVVGKTLILNDRIYRVVGILPEGFRWIFQNIACGLWMPLKLNTITDTDRDSRGMRAIARLKPDVTIAQAQAEMDLIAQRLARAFPETNSNRGIHVIPMNEEYKQKNAAFGKPRMLTILSGVVFSVLCIACLHVSSLLIARSGGREREIAVRMAMGAHRLRLLRQLLTENLLLAILGGLLGGFLAYWGLKLLTTLRGQAIPWSLGHNLDRLIPWYINLTLDVRSLLYISAISLLTCVAFGLLPALGASRTDLNRSLSAGRTVEQTPRFHGLRTVLVVLDIALSLILLVGAGLLVNSYIRIMNIDLRYNTRNVMTADFAYDWRNPPPPEQRLTKFQEALKSIRLIPGVHAVSLANYHPVTGSFSTPPFQIEGNIATRVRVGLPQTAIFPDYFRVLQIPLLQGRYFTEHDTKTSLPVVIINETMAQRFWPSKPAVGMHITSVPREDSKPMVYQVVGVVENVWRDRYGPNEPEIYIPYLQSDYSPEITFIIKTATDSANLAATIRKELTAQTHGALVAQVTPIDGQIANLYVSERINMLFLSALSVLALVLACVGVYGTTAYAVSRRTHEIGIRMALGARGNDVLRMVLRQGFTLTGIGLVFGLVGSLAATRMIRSFLYDISPTDPVTFICVSLLLTAAALLASYLPARRAARIDPMTALRYE